MSDSAPPAACSIDLVDVHAHFVPDVYRQALLAAGMEHADGMPGIPAWSAEAALELMDRLGVATAVLSISSPGVHFGNDAAAGRLARLCNEEGARLRRVHPGRFGHMASVPLPDVEGAIAEAAHALDVLGSDGVVLQTHQSGVYLGDPRLEPFWSALDARGAVVFVHPTSPACPCSSRLDATFPRPVFEFMFETTRSITDMVTAGVLGRHRGIKVIVPHAGAALPVLMDRIDMVLPALTPPGAAAPPSLIKAMRELHFDLAGVPLPRLLEALLQVADPGRIHYGSDYPHTPAARCEMLMQALEETPLLGPELWREVSGGNARRLFPSLRAPAAA